MVHFIVEKSGVRDLGGQKAPGLGRIAGENRFE